MSYNYRCSRDDCRKRSTFKRKIEDYVRPKICLGCKRTDSLRPDKTVKVWNRSKTCRCDGYHYPHMTGAEPWCCDAKNGPTDEDHENRHRDLHR